MGTTYAGVIIETAKWLRNVTSFVSIMFISFMRMVFQVGEHRRVMGFVRIIFDRITFITLHCVENNHVRHPSLLYASSVFSNKI